MLGGAGDRGQSEAAPQIVEKKPGSLISTDTNKQPSLIFQSTTQLPATRSCSVCDFSGLPPDMAAVKWGNNTVKANDAASKSAKSFTTSFLMTRAVTSAENATKALAVCEKSACGLTR